MSPGEAIVWAFAFLIVVFASLVALVAFVTARDIWYEHKEDRALRKDPNTYKPPTKKES